MGLFKVKVEGVESLRYYLRNIKVANQRELNKSLNEIGSYLEGKVKDKFGVYQHGWPKLKTATVLAKQRRRSSLRSYKKASFTKFIKKFNKAIGGDDPLVLFGKLHQSIKHQLRGTKMDKEAVVYSDNEYSAVHEYGYAPKNIPARSYMRTTLLDEEDYIVQIISNRIGNIVRRKVSS